jgi:hypothetical protein
MEEAVRGRVVGLFAAGLACAAAFLTLAPQPSYAFDAYWFTQRGRNLRAGTRDDPVFVPRETRGPPPPVLRCAPGGGSPDGSRRPGGTGRGGCD